MQNKNVILLLMILTLAFSGCYQKYISDFDPVLFEEIIRVSQEVDLFYIRLLEAPDDQRQFDRFRSEYYRIEMELKTLVLRSSLRPLNELSTSQINRLLAEWIKERNRHKEKDNISSGKAEILREQFSDHFLAIAIGESSKPKSEENNMGK